MKTSMFKRMLSLLLVAAMLCGFGITALADPATPSESNVTVTIQGDQIVHGDASGEGSVTLTAEAKADPVEGWTVADTQYKWSNDTSGAEAEYAIQITSGITAKVDATVTYTNDETRKTKSVTVTSDGYRVELGYDVSAEVDASEDYTLKLSKSGLVKSGETVTAEVAAKPGYQIVSYKKIYPAESVKIDKEDVVFTAVGVETALKKATVQYDWTTGLPAKADLKTLTIKGDPSNQEVTYGSSFTPSVTGTVEVEVTGGKKLYEITGWKYDGKTSLDKAIDASTDGTIDASAVWGEKKNVEYTITFPANGTNYTVEHTPVKTKYMQGDVITVTVKAAKGYKLDSALTASATKGSPSSMTTDSAKGTATFTYTVGDGDATISLSNTTVTPITVSFEFNMNTKNSGKLTRDGTATPASVTKTAVKYNALADFTPATSGKLVTAAADGGSTYELAGWTCSTTSFDLSIEAATLKTILGDKHEDVKLTFQAKWDDGMQITAELACTKQSLRMDEETADDYSLAEQLDRLAPTAAAYIKFTSFGSSSIGTLYVDDESNTKAALNTFYEIGSDGEFEEMQFRPASKVGEDEDFVVEFDLYDRKTSAATKLGSCKMIINTGVEADIYWEMGGDESIQFAADDFEEFFRSEAGKNKVFDCVNFEDFGDRYDGYLCYDGTDSEDILTGRDLYNEDFYYEPTGSKDKDLSKLYYIIGSDKGGCRVIEFTAYGTTGNTGYDGILVISLDGESNSDGGDLSLTYNVKYNSTLNLISEDIADWFGSGLDYIVFDEDYAGTLSVGTGKNEEILGDDLDEDTEFYYDPAKNELGIDELIYTPKKASRYTQSVDTIDFTAYGTRTSNTKEGTLTICIVYDDVPQVTVKVDPKKSVTFTDSAFESVAKTALGSSTSFKGIALESLPGKGTLYHDTSRATAGTIYSTGATASKRISKLNYTADTAEGTYKVTYGAYNASGSLLYVGKLAFQVGDNALSAGSISALGTAFSGTQIENQAKKNLDKDFSYITIAQPSNAIVYYDYDAINEHEGAADVSEKYYLKPSSSQLAIADLTVVPYADRASGETVDVEITCYDAAGNSYKMTLRYTYSKTTKTSFSDVTEDWYKDSIYFLSSNKIVNGVSTSKYGVGTNIKRGDFVLMLYRAFNLNELTKSTSSFADVKSADYYAAAIGTAKALGITNGYNVNGSYYFYPEKSITREEAFVLIYRTLNLSGVKSQLANTLPSASSLTGFSDSKSVQSYATSAIASLAKAEIIKGSGGKLNPANPISREEMAVILHRALTRY